jgi:predicted nucleotidyltransferase
MPCAAQGCRCAHAPGGASGRGWKRKKMAGDGRIITVGCVLRYSWYNTYQEVLTMGKASQAVFEELNTELDRIVSVLINEYDPQKIILFGSLASGNIHEFSDIDLIVIKESDKGFYDRLEEVGLLIMPEITGADILVYTPKEFESKKDSPFFREEVFKKGKVLYDAKAS